MKEIKTIKKEVKPYRRKLNKEQDIIDKIVGQTPMQRYELEKTTKYEVVDETDNIKTMTPIVDEIFDMEKEKFTAEKLAFSALNKDLQSKRPNPKYVTMVVASQFKKPKVSVNINVDNMSPQELIDFMVKAKKSKGEV